VLLFLALGCGGGEPARPPDPLDGGWPQQVAETPLEFESLMAGGAREGWVAFHAADWPTAAEKLDGIGRRRALIELATLEDDLARLSAEVWERAARRWVESAGVPEGSALPVLAALSAYDSADAARGAAWLDQARGALAPDVAAVAAQLRERGLAEIAGEGLAACLAGHLAARKSASLEPLSACPAGPLVREPAGDHERTLHDPLLARTRAIVHRAQAEAIAIPAEPGLAALLFSGDWTAADRGPNPPTLGLLGLGPLSGPDEVQPARERVRAADARLDAWIEGRTQGADEAEIGVYADLQLLGLYRSRLLVNEARAALLGGRPHQAAATAQLALDAQHGRAIGPLNPPALFAVLAEANLRTGRTREALDSIEVLGGAYPFVQGLDETLSDLVILEGMGRAGDSKE
jgi:hypothetical protein